MEREGGVGGGAPRPAGEWRRSASRAREIIIYHNIIGSRTATWPIAPSAANVLYSFQPVWNAALAALVLGEQLDAAEVAGGALIIAGAILAAEAQQQQCGEE